MAGGPHTKTSTGSEGGGGRSRRRRVVALEEVLQPDPSDAQGPIPVHGVPRADPGVGVHATRPELQLELPDNARLCTALAPVVSAGRCTECNFPSNRLQPVQLGSGDADVCGFCYVGLETEALLASETAPRSRHHRALLELESVLVTGWVRHVGYVRRALEADRVAARARPGPYTRP